MPARTISPTKALSKSASTSTPEIIDGNRRMSPKKIAQTLAASPCAIPRAQPSILSATISCSERKKKKMKMTTTGGMLRSNSTYVRANIRTVRLFTVRATPMITPRNNARTLA